LELADEERDDSELGNLFTHFLTCRLGTWGLSGGFSFFELEDSLMGSGKLLRGEKIVAHRYCKEAGTGRKRSWLKTGPREGEDRGLSMLGWLGDGGGRIYSRGKSIIASGNAWEIRRGKPFLILEQLNGIDLFQVAL